MYHGGHFENENTKFVEYKVDYFDFCLVDYMSMFELGAMVSEAIGKKSAGTDMCFKSPTEGMEKISKLETDGDILLMTWLISEKVQYVEVFVVLIEPIEVVGLPLGQQNIATANVPIVDVDEV